MRIKHLVIGCLILALPIISGCTVNPVTGESQLTIMSPAQEVAVGEQQYQPSLQSQGGVYVVDEKLNRYVNSVGQKLAAKSDRPDLPYEFVVLNNDTPNAWALPGGKIAINRGLLYLLEDEAQLAAVLAHEIVHAAARHGAAQHTQSVLLGVSGQLLTVVGDAYGYGDLTGQGVALGSSLLSARYSQSQELQSDSYGMDYMARAGYEPLGAVELQQAFVKLSEGRQSNPLAAFFQSHPPSQSRVKANLAKARELPSGVRNREAYQRATRQIRQDKHAYDVHQQALALASEKKYSEATAKTKQAIKLQSKESHFWGTLGRLQMESKDYTRARKSLNEAVALNNNYFANFLYRGLLSLQQKQYAEAKNDLSKSNGKLGTQMGSYYLAQAELGLGNTQRAQKLLTAVQQAGGELGQAAAEQLQELSQPQ